MDTEDHKICKYDGVSVKERDTLIGKTCGTEGEDIVSWDNRVTLNFYSDHSNTGRGFVVHYTAIVYDTIEVTSSE